MNTFGMGGFEQRGFQIEPGIPSEEIQAAIRDLHEPIDVDRELSLLTKAFAHSAEGSQEHHELRVRRAALLAYGKSRELPIHRQTTSVSDAQDIPALSSEKQRDHDELGMYQTHDERRPSKPIRHLKTVQPPVSTNEERTGVKPLNLEPLHIVDGPDIGLAAK